MAIAKVIEWPVPRAAQPRRFGSVRLRPGSSRLWIRFSYHGQRIDKPSGLENTPENVAELEAFLSRVGQAIKAGTFRFGEAFPDAPEEEKEFFGAKEGVEYTKPAAEVTFEEYLKRWMPANLDNEPSATKRRDYTQVLESRLRERFGPLSFQQINGVVLVQFIKELRAEKLSTSRIRNILIPLRIAWEDACVEHGWELPSPFEHLKRRNRGNRLIPRRKKNPPEVFRFDEWERMRAGLDDWNRPIAELMLLTGMIASEAARLTKDHIRKDALAVPGTKSQYRERVLPLTAPLRAILDALSARGPALVTRPGGQPFKARVFWTAWKNALARAGLPYRRPYAARHTFAIWQLLVGTHPERLVKLMGHGSKEMVYEVYGRYTEGLEEDAERIRAYLLGS